MNERFEVARQLVDRDVARGIHVEPRHGLLGASAGFAIGPGRGRLLSEILGEGLDVFHPRERELLATFDDGPEVLERRTRGE